jgi:hypothetical protein
MLVKLTAQSFPTGVSLRPFSKRTQILGSLIGAVALGAGVAALSPDAAFLRGWLAASLLLWIGFYLLLSAWKAMGGGGRLGLVMALAFLLRLGLGMGLSLALPVLGYDDPSQKAGYLFYDAYRRDTEAWQLAQSDEPLTASFGEEFTTDQYGGLLSISAGIYRYLSPDAHRPFLVLILAAVVFTLGVPFFWQAVRQRWSERLANLAAWIMILYPDSILYSSSQMREPFLIGLIGIAFWSVLNLRQERRLAPIGLGASLLAMALISSRVTVAVLAVLALWFWLERLVFTSSRWRWLGWAVLVLGALALAFFSWEWLRDTSHWDLLVTERSSGRVQLALEELGGRFRVPFIIGYGLAQPVLPAAIADSALPLWKTIIIVRAAGWYALAPFLLYAFFTVWKAQPVQERWTWIWLAAIVLVWILISSARAGGDQWDNPRYRTIFIPWMALLAGWAIHWALERRDWWLARWLVVEMIFLGYFTNWYFSRYFNLWKRLPFWEMVLWIVIWSAIVLGSGWLWDLGRWLYRRSRQRPVE